MPGQLCHCLFVYAAVKHSRYEIMAEGVQMKSFWKAILIVDFPQMLGEGVRMDEAAGLVRKEVILVFSPLSFPGFLVVVFKYICHDLIQSDYPAPSVLGCAFCDTLSRHHATGTVYSQSSALSG